MAAKKKAKLTREEADYLKFTRSWLTTEETILQQLTDQIAFNTKELDQHRRLIRHERIMQKLQQRKIAKVRREFLAWKRKVGLP